jgi:hypothetical protein
MRGAFVDQGGLFSYIAPEARVPANHPLRKIRELLDWRGSWSPKPRPQGSGRGFFPSLVGACHSKDSVSPYRGSMSRLAKMKTKTNPEQS